MSELCDQCRQDDVVAECGHCNDGRGYCGACLMDHDCAGREDQSQWLNRRERSNQKPGITNHEGERVWLKPRFNHEGKRIGITDCCPEDDPCDHHKMLEGATIVETEQ